MNLENVVSRVKDLSKRENGARQFENIQSIFRCPLCGEGLHVTDAKSIRCLNNHNFDFAKQGYINFLARPIHSDYDRALFDARRTIMNTYSFFQPLLRAIENELMKMDSFSNETSDLWMLDAGCGEGTHLNALSESLAKRSKRVIHGIGIDISKDGILAAAKRYADRIWMVADLVHPPLREKSMDLLLNILSPSNYRCFHHLLKPGGMVIKVVPGSAYLQEIRTFFYDSEKKGTYSNSAIISHFYDHFSEFQTFPIHYSKKLDQEAMQAIIRMTPLAWTADEAKKKAWLDVKKRSVTIDLSVLIGLEKEK
ncbi:MAG: putative RNA methyltransferase [Sporolactobacillus sp.]